MADKTLHRKLKMDHLNHVQKNRGELRQPGGASHVPVRLVALVLLGAQCLYGDIEQNNNKF